MEKGGEMEWLQRRIPPPLTGLGLAKPGQCSAAASGQLGTWYREPIVTCEEARPACILYRAPSLDMAQLSHKNRLPGDKRRQLCFELSRRNILQMEH